MKFYWMKNTLAALLCAGVLLASCACDDQNKSNIVTTTTTTTNTGGPATPPSEDAVSFESYTEVLTTFRSLLQCKLSDGFSGLEAYPRPEYADERSQNIGSNLLLLSYHVSPKEMCYANRDFDADGIPELILLSEDHTLAAIFTLQNSRPVLLDIFFDFNDRGAIDKDGYVFKSGYTKGDTWYKSVRLLKSGTLEPIVEYGCRDHTDEGGSLEYFMISADGNRITVPKSEIDAIETMYRPTFSELDKITFEAIPDPVPFFNLPENADSPLSLLYRAMMDGRVLVHVYTGSYRYYAQLGDTFYNMTGHKLEAASFSMVDMSGDGVNELILQAPNHKTVAIYYEDGIFYAHSLFEVDWLYTDGMIAQHDVHGYWGEKLQFDGGTLHSKTVYEVIWGKDGSPDTLCLDGKEVTEEAFRSYVETYSAEKVKWHGITSQNLELYVAANDRPPKIDFSTYDAVIDSYRTIAALAPICYEAAKDGYEPGMYDAYFDLPDDADQRKIFTALFDAITARYTAYYSERTQLMYAYKDLNRDGVDELILLTEEYEILAIFTRKNGRPHLLTYDTSPKGIIWIDADGYIRTEGSYVGGSTEMNFFMISDGELKLIEGLSRSVRADNTNSVRYDYIFEAPETSIGFGSREITEEEYNAVLSKYIRLSVNDIPEHMKAELELDEFRLFPTELNTSPSHTWITNQNPNLPDTKTVTIERTGGDCLVFFRFLPPEEDEEWEYYTAKVQLGENNFADECSFMTDKLAGTLSFGIHCMWLTVEQSEFEDLPIGTYLLYDRDYYYGK